MTKPAEKITLPIVDPDVPVIPEIQLQDAQTPMAEAVRGIAENHAKSAKEDALHVALDHYDVLSKGLANVDKDGNVPDGLFTDEEWAEIGAVREKFESDRPEVVDAALDLVEAMAKTEDKTAKRSAELSTVRTKINRAKRLGLDQPEIDKLIAREKKLVAKLEKQKGKEENAISKVHARVKQEASDKVFDRIENADPFEFWGYKESESPKAKPASAEATEVMGGTPPAVDDTGDKETSDADNVASGEPVVEKKAPVEEPVARPSRPGREARRRALGVDDAGDATAEAPAEPTEISDPERRMYSILDEIQASGSRDLETLLAIEDAESILADTDNGLSADDRKVLRDMLDGAVAALPAIEPTSGVYDFADEDPSDEPHWRDSEGAADDDDEFDVPDFLRGADHGVPSGSYDGDATTTLPGAEPAPATETTVAGTPESTQEKLEFSVGLAEKARHGEDTSLVEEDLGLFGVFDGMGSGSDPKLASGTAAEAVKKTFSEAEPPKTVDEAVSLMRSAFSNALDAIAATGTPNNITTAVVAKVLEVDGKRYAVFGNAGDSRSFIHRADGSYEAVTEDQSSGNRIHNGMGINPDGSIASEWVASNEYIVRELAEGDRIMLASDGITGDWEDQFLSESEMLDALSQPTTQESADKFLAISKKNDDKTVIVVEVERGATPRPAASEETEVTAAETGTEADAESAARAPRYRGLGRRALGFVGAVGRGIFQDRLAPVDDPSRPGPRLTPRPAPVAPSATADAPAAPVRAVRAEPETGPTPASEPALVASSATAEPLTTTAAVEAPVEAPVVVEVDPVQASRQQEVRTLMQEIAAGMADRTAPRGSTAFIARSQRMRAILEEAFPEKAAFDAAIGRVLKGKDPFTEDE